jgi:hypothetical protein
MPKRGIRPQTSRHVFIYDEDWEFLQNLYGRGSRNPVGVSRVVQELIHQKVKGLRQAVANKLDQGGSAPSTEE